MKKTNNIKVNRKGKGEVVITINTLFYPKDYILRTAEKFEDICWTNLEGDPNGCLFLSLKPKKAKEIDLNSLGYEFMNHLLAEIKDEVSW
jgi:hypothetical protein